MAKLKIGRMMLGSCQTNCYFVYQEGEKEVILFDPADQGEYIYNTLEKNGFVVKAIFLTHGHFDHILGCQKLRQLSGAKVYAYEAEKALCEDSGTNLSSQTGMSCTIKPNVYLKDGETLTIADMTLKTIWTPGHTIGGCCYYFEEAGILISGDTLFQESVGRTDFPTGSFSTLVASIKEKLFVLPDDVQVYPGHGEATSIGYEKEHNPFC